jgi:hypothetical protein
MSTVAEPTEELGVLRGMTEVVDQELNSPPSAPSSASTAGQDTVPSTRSEQRWAWYQRVEDAVLDLSSALPQGTEDYDARKLWEFLLGLRRAIQADADLNDERGEVELAVMKMGDVVRRLARRLEHDELDDPRAAADSILGTLSGIGVGDLSRLLGVSTKTVNTWRTGGPVTRNTDRVVVLAQLLTYLRASMSPAGLVMWFDAPRHQLEGRTPLELLDENVAVARDVLVSLARGARGQLAS